MPPGYARSWVPLFALDLRLEPDLIAALITISRVGLVYGLLAERPFCPRLRERAASKYMGHITSFSLSGMESYSWSHLISSFVSSSAEGII